LVFSEVDVQIKTSIMKISRQTVGPGIKIGVQQNWGRKV